MSFTLLGLFDLIGTIAFAISGAFVGIRRKMDIFGVNVLAITTACGGGLMRDLIIGDTPPRMFQNPFYVIVAILVAHIVFVSMSCHKKMPRQITSIYDQVLFWFDTFGLAAFTVDGIIIGVDAGFHGNPFLLVFLGCITGVGGGALRDIMANQMPDIFVKHIYAVASIAGGIFMVVVFTISQSRQIAMIAGVAVILLLRFLAAHFGWNLPSVDES